MKAVAWTAIGALTIGAGSVWAGGSCEKSASNGATIVKAGHQEEAKDIIDTAVAAGQFNTLAAALTAAGLVDALKGDGPFTVFAPTDEAFAKLPKGTVESLLQPENKDKLVKILTFHVLKGEVKAEQVVGTSESSATLAGQTFQIAVEDGSVMIGNDNAMATVIKTDILASNGVIHVIDTVILPN